MTKEKTMFSITSTFTAAGRGPGPDLFWMVLLAIAITNDSDRRNKARRDQRDTPAVKPRDPAP